MQCHVFCTIPEALDIDSVTDVIFGRKVTMNLFETDCEEGAYIIR